MGAVRISLFMSIAFFALLSIGITNASLTANPNPYAFTPGNVLDIGQNTIANTVISGGIGPYTGNWVLTAPQSSNIPVTNTIVAYLPSTTNALTLTINAISSNSLEFTFNGVSYYANAIGTNTIYGVWTITGNAADSATNTIAVTNTLTIDPALAFTSLTASNSLIDEGQTQVITAQVSGGAAPYTYNFMVYNSIGLVANALYTGVSATSNSFTFTQNSAWGTGPFTVNAYITDSANSPVTVSNTIVYVANAPLATPQVSILNTLLDEGQPITIAASFTGGTSPYTYNFIISQSGTPSNIIAYSGPVSNSLTSNSFVWVTNAIGTFVANVIVKDSASTPETANSVYSVPFSVNAYPTATSLTPSNTILDSGQYVTYNVLISGGTLPITAKLILVSNSIPIQINGANALPGNTYNTIVTGSDSIITFNSLLITTSSSTGGSVTFNVIAVDSANTPVTFNAVANTITVNPALTVSISPSSATYDAGQTISLTATPSGGTSPYSYQWYNDTSGNPVAITGATSATYTATASATGTFKYYVVVKDSATTPTSATSSTGSYTVNPTPTTTSLTPSSTILDSGQYETYNVIINGGTLPITANLIYVNGPSGATINGNIPGNVLQTITLPIGSTEPNTITFNSFKLITSGSYTFNVIAVDSASTPITFNAVANTITVNPTPTITLSAAPSNSIMYGSQFTINAVISGGTGDFAVYWYLNSNSIAPTVIGTNIMTSNTMVLPAAGNYLYMVEANDIGTSSVYTLAPATNTIIVAQNNTLSASASGNPGSSYYSYPVTITFTGTPTINHQAKWSLYVNGALYGTTNSTITYYEEFAPPGTYNFVFNLTSDANYTPYTYTTSLLISYPPTGTYGTTTTVTTATTTVTTTSIPTTSVTTTIPPSQKAISIASTISSSSPLVLNLPNALSSVYVYTTSTTSAPIVAHIANVTQQVSSFAKPQPNYTLINAVNISIETTAPITAFFVGHYPCSIPSDLVVPYIFKNNTWLAITNYTVNATACTVSFNIPSDPIVAIFEKSVPTTTTTSIATTIPTTIPTTIYYPLPSPKPRSPIVVEALILIIILIAIILVLLYYYKLLHRKYHGFKR